MRRTSSNDDAQVNAEPLLEDRPLLFVDAPIPVIVSAAGARIMLKIEREIPIQIDPGENPFLKGIYAPIATEITADDLTVIGEIPSDLDGAYLRNGPNPIFPPRGRYHWFDGDGMVHGIEFHDGKATYRNRWIRTEAFDAEQAAQRTIWPGLMDRPDPDAPR